MSNTEHTCENCGGHVQREFIHCPEHPYTPPLVFIIGSDIVAECPACDEEENIIAVFPLDCSQMEAEVEAVSEPGQVQ